jgi:hypothetical protein
VNSAPPNDPERPIALRNEGRPEPVHEMRAIQAVEHIPRHD